MAPNPNPNPNQWGQSWLSQLSRRRWGHSAVILDIRTSQECINLETRWHDCGSPHWSSLANAKSNLWHIWTLHNQARQFEL
jgi:hypothetical protein